MKSKRECDMKNRDRKEVEEIRRNSRKREKIVTVDKKKVEIDQKEIKWRQETNAAVERDRNGQR